jgi:hypothetical protein
LHLWARIEFSKGCWCNKKQNTLQTADLTISSCITYRAEQQLLDRKQDRHRRSYPDNCSSVERLPSQKKLHEEADTKLYDMLSLTSPYCTSPFEQIAIATARQ